MRVEEGRGKVGGGEYEGVVYWVREERGKKVGNGLKWWVLGKWGGYEGVEKKFVGWKWEMKERKVGEMRKGRVVWVVEGSYEKERFIWGVKEKGIDRVVG